MTAFSKVFGVAQYVRSRGKWNVGVHLCAVGVTLLLAAGPAQANTPITSYAALPSTTQAGGHPDLGISFTVANRVVQKSQSACNCEDAKDATVHLPNGFIGSPNATPQCSLADFSSDSCPIDSQVGIANIGVSNAGIVGFDSAVYNLIPPPDQAGLLGFKIFFFNSPQFTVLSGRTDGDYGLDAKVTSIYHSTFPLLSFQQVLWGVPADPSHDPLRLDPRFNPSSPGTTDYLGLLCDANGVLSTADPNTVKEPCFLNFATIPPAPSNSPLTPFLQNPTTCDAPLGSSLDLLSYDGGVDHAESAWPQGTGCDQLSFNPSLYAQPTTTQTDSPSGIDVNLSVPQPLSPTIPSPTELRAATVTLPLGFSINPNAADGKSVCADSEANFGTLAAAQCPEFSKVASLEIDDPALPGPLPGFVYLGQPSPGNRYRIFLVADGFATHVKLPGSVTPDPATGQLTINFQNLPETPLTAFNMHFFGSERGLLATPTQCGSYPVTSTFTPWDSSLPPQTSTQFFTLDSGPGGVPCPGPSRPFAPSFEAASVSNAAGAHTPFTVDVNRNDGDQNLAGLTVSTPLGFSATLKGAAYCPQLALDRLAHASYGGLAEQTSPSCPSASQIGTAIAGAGAGTHPLYTPGKVYLAGPYKGSPLSLEVVIPAVSGPYDLGNVAVRAAIKVDPISARVTTVSDPLPQILEGIPLRLRSILINLDRPGFTLNPTSCDPSSIGATLSGDQGALTDLSFGFQVANCAALSFAPKLALRFTGGLNRRGHPAIHAVLQAEPGEANVRSVSVTLPPNELLDNSHIDTVCTKADFAAQSCPAGSLLGHAQISTPLLDQPLQGPAYLRSSANGLPDLALDLHGQIHIVAIAGIDAVNGGLRTTFRAVPDVPLGTVTLDLRGGSKGLVQNSESLCDSHDEAALTMRGQNGGSLRHRIPLAAACGKRAGKSHGAHGVPRVHQSRSANR